MSRQRSTGRWEFKKKQPILESMTDAENSLPSTSRKLNLLIKRLVAGVIDLVIIILAIYLVYSVILSVGILVTGASFGRPTPDWVDTFFGAAFYIAGPTWFMISLYLLARQEVRKGRTPGKKILGLVISSQKPGVIRHTLRGFIKYAPLTMLYLTLFAVDIFDKNPNYEPAPKVVIIITFLLLVAVPFVWLTTFILSARGRFPHDMLFGTNVVDVKASS